MRSIFHPLAVLMCLTTLLASGQTPLQPLWVHTWPFGNTNVSELLPLAIDNHVSVDPVSGDVFVSIDDQDQLFSQRWELLYSFTPDGTEITPDPIPLLGTLNDPFYPEVNEENTRQLEVFDGGALQAHSHGAPILNGLTRSFVLRRPDGTTWKASLGLGSMSADITTSVHFDEAGPILGGSADGTTGWLCTASDQAWPIWAASYPGTHAVCDIVVANGTIYAASRGTILMVDRATGQLLGQMPISTTALSMQLATDGGYIYYAWANNTGPHWGKRSLTGDVIWDQQATDASTLNEMKVDALGRIWMCLIPFAPNSGGRLLISTTDGSAYEQFSYGATINDIDLDADRAYLTGQVDTLSTETYLIAIGTDMNVGQPGARASSPMELSPVPAVNVLNIGIAMEVGSLEVLDAAGRTVLRPSPTTRVLNIATLAPGAYSLRARTREGTLQRRFLVAH